MAVVGSAEIVVRAITLKVADDIKKAFADARPTVSAAGKDHAKAYSEGFSGSVKDALPQSIEQSLKRTNARAPGKEKGSDFASSFSAAVTSGINIDDFLKNIDASGVGSKAGKTIVDEVEQETKQLEPKVKQNFTRAGGSAGGGFIDGFKSIAGDWSSLGLGKSAENAAKQFTTLVATGQAVGAAITLVVGGLSSLVSGLFAVGSAVGSAVGALGALPGVLSVAAQGMLTLKLAMSGIGAAVKLGLKPAGPAAAAAGKAVVSAQNRVADAVRNANRAIADASQALKGAYRDAAEAAATAAANVAKAENNLAEAQNKTRLAQLALTDARKAGAESLQQLGFSTEGAALAEQRAALSLEDALRKLQAVQDLPPSNRARIEAELAFKEAELQYRESKDHAADLKKENEDAADSGVEGTKEVVDAKNDIIDAQNNEAASEAALRKARADQAKSAVQSAEQIAAAQQRLSRAQADGARSVAEAQKALADAQNKTTASVDAYKEALKQLSPEQQAFVKYLVSIQKETLKLKAAAGEEFLPKLQKALEPIVKNLFPIFQDQLKTAGSLLGDAALKISGVVTSADGLKQIERIMGGNNAIIAVAGDIFGNLASIFLDVMEAVQPLTLQFSQFVRQLTGGWKASLKTKDGMKKLTDFFAEGGKVAGKLYHIFKSVWDIIKTLGGAAKDSGNDLLTSFQGALDKLNEFLTAPGKKQDLQKFFKQAAANTKIIFSILGSIGAYLLKLGGDPKTGAAFQSIKDAGPYFKTIADQLKVSLPAFGRLVKAVARVFAAFTAGDSASSLFDSLAWTANRFADILGSSVIQKLLKIVAFTLGILHAFKLLLIGGGALGKIFLGMISPLVKMWKLFQLIRLSVKAIGLKATLGKAVTAVKARIPGTKANAAAKAAEEDKKGDAGTGKFTGNLKKLSEQFVLTGKAKDKFIRNLQELSGQFAKTSGAAGKAAAKTPVAAATKSGLVKGSAASKAGFAPPPLKQSVILVPPAPGAINQQMRIVGAAAASGFAEGLSPKTPVQRMEALTQATIQANKRMLGIASPSKVFLALGRNLGLALGAGMKETQGVVKAEGAALAASATVGGKAGVATAGAKAGAGSAVVAATAPIAKVSKASKAVGGLGKVIGGIGKVGGGALGLLMGPIGLIATIAIPLLIAGFKKLYKNSAGFRNFIDKLVAGLKTFGGMIKLWILDTAIPAFKKFGEGVAVQLKPLITIFQEQIMPKIKEFADFIIPIFQKYLPIVFEAWKMEMAVVFAVVGGIIKVAVAIIVFLVTKILIPLFVYVIIPAVKTMAEAVRISFGIIQTVVGVVFAVIQVLWEKILKPVIMALIDNFRLAKVRVANAFNAIHAAWKWVVDGILRIWNKYLKPFIDNLVDTWRRRINTIVGYINLIKLGFTDTINSIKTWWEKHGQPIVDKIGGSFKAFGKGVAKIFDALKDAPAKGIRTMIDNINKWLIHPLTALTTKFGLDIPDIKIPAGLAEGGEITGKGGPTEDRELRRVSPGEWVIREKAARAVGRHNMALLNKTGALPMVPTAVTEVAHALPKGSILNDYIKKPGDVITGLLKKGAGNAIGALTEGFKSLLPKGDGYIEKFFRGIFDKFSQAAKDWGDKKQAAADAAAAATADGNADAGGASGARGVWNALVSTGMNAQHAAGIMGNIQAESGFSPTIVQGGGHSNTPYGHGSRGYGLVQWTPGSKLGPYLNGKPPTIANEINALMAQLKGKGGASEKTAGNKFFAAKSVAEAARAFHIYYERSASTNSSGRVANAQKWYKKYKNVGGDGSPIDVSNPKGRTTWHGGKFTNLFAANLAAAQKLANVTIRVMQGGFRPATSYSGTSHRGDAIDLQVSNALIRALRSLKIAAGDRTGLGNWAGHVHAIPGPGAGYGAGSAVWQWKDYLRRGGQFQSYHSRWGLAEGGTVFAKSGGINALLGEGGQNERVEPLDSSGLSARDRAMIELLAKRQDKGSTGNIDVRVFIGDQELTNLVDVRIATRNRELNQSLNAGTKRRYRA